VSSKVFDAASVVQGRVPTPVSADTSTKAPPHSANVGLDATQHGRAELDRGDSAELARQEEIKLVQRVFMTSGKPVRRAVLFAGVERENGCIAVCVRAGQTLARLTPNSVCVVDANLRTPALQCSLGTDDDRGLAAAIAQSSLASPFAVRATPDNLWLLPSGASPWDPDVLFTPDRVRPRFEELSGMFDHLLVNAPPINLYAESLALCQFVDGVVLVLQANATRREIVRDVKVRLEEFDVPLLGIVLNNRTFPIPDVVYRRL
jgi:Mrp family chromosome partitioning ATPase